MKSDSNHESAARFGVGCLREDLDEWKSSRRDQCRIKIAQAEENCDEHA